ncbi:MAG: glycoside hydrolase family 16 protein [Opitutales bacterium]
MDPRMGYDLVYSEEFNGSQVDEGSWYYRVYEKPERFWGGYGDKDNVSVDTENGIGRLQIAYTKEDKDGDGVSDPVGGGLISRTTFGYGYYEAKVKLYDEEPGFHQAFWSAGILGLGNKYPEDFEYRLDAANDRVPISNMGIEIDGLEFDSAFELNEGFSNFHWWIPKHEKLEGARKDHDSSYINVNEWITLGYEWIPGRITYFFDDIVRHVVNYDAQDPRFTPSEVIFSGLANTTWPWNANGQPGSDAAFLVDYFRFYTKPFIGTNYVGNAGFETQARSSPYPLNWVVDDGIYDNYRTDGVRVVYTDGNAHTGHSYLIHEGQTGAPPVTSRMRLDNIANGPYALSAWVHSSGDWDICSISIGSNGTVLETREIPPSNGYIQLSIKTVTVLENEVDIEFTTQGAKGRWLRVDDVMFVPLEQ